VSISSFCESADPPADQTPRRPHRSPSHLTADDLFIDRRLLVRSHALHKRQTDRLTEGHDSRLKPHFTGGGLIMEILHSVHYLLTYLYILVG